MECELRAENHCYRKWTLVRMECELTAENHCQRRHRKVLLKCKYDSILCRMRYSRVEIKQGDSQKHHDRTKWKSLAFQGKQNSPNESVSFNKNRQLHELSMSRDNQGQELLFSFMLPEKPLTKLWLPLETICQIFQLLFKRKAIRLTWKENFILKQKRFSSLHPCLLIGCISAISSVEIWAVMPSWINRKTLPNTYL